MAYAKAIISASHVAIKFFKMKKLSTVTKIGEAALTVLFSDKKKEDTTLSFLKEDYNIESPFQKNPKSFNRSYSLWGIETGIVSIAADETTSAAIIAAILKGIKEKRWTVYTNIPSHFIIHEHELLTAQKSFSKYDIYRLSENQQKVIRAEVLRVVDIPGWEMVF